MTTKKFTQKYRAENLYITIVPDKKEVFLSAVDNTPEKLTSCGLEIIGRLSSVVWQEAGLEKLKSQLTKSTFSQADMPGKILKCIETTLALEEV